MTTYAEHVKWCKERAREYLDMGDTSAAYRSMVSDMTKHPETVGAMHDLAVRGMLLLKQGDEEGVRAWVEGVPEE